MIIAEIGLNHLGSEQRVEWYIDKLIDTDVDAVTLQVRESEYYNTKWNDYDLELDKDIYFDIRDKLHSVGKKFGIAIADINYIHFFESLGVDFYKVIRNDITNFELIDKLKDTEKEIIVSTGLSSDEDISKFINHIGDNKNFKLNHTQLSYDVEDCNLSAIENMKSRYGKEVSFGSHCNNTSVLYMALCYEPSDILFYVKHEEWTPQLHVPDSKHAIEISDVYEFVKNLKLLSTAIGSGTKQKMENKLR